MKAVISAETQRLDDIFMVIVLAIVILILSAMVVSIFRFDRIA